ncbi:MAG: cryptochrome/photolyase family protein [Candidatus Zhuqueibacterota bacterium]
MKKFNTSLFIFRRDLRLEDNSGLREALLRSREVIPCFIFDPRQVEPHPYRSRPGLLFMVKALQDLHVQLTHMDSGLSLFFGDPARVLEQILAGHAIDAVFFNHDYTPFSRQRDAQLNAACEKLNTPFIGLHDALLTDPGAALKKDGFPYTVFTPFFNHASKLAVPLPNSSVPTNLSAKRPGQSHDEIFGKVLPPDSELASVPAGRSRAMEILSGLERFRQYETERDVPELDATTRLSVHFKFGACSIREAYYSVFQQLGEHHPLIRQFYWRDFFTLIGYFFPHVFGHAFKRKYDGLVWENNADKFQAWCQGQTGYPIVDAGMRELNETGFMHNRLRMIVASFLVKDLRIDWRWGEAYFARHLLDYDPCVNNGNWQWAASIGCDAQPYFRIFNPWNQQKKFDGECRYIRKWVSELSDFTPATIHGLESGKGLSDYPACLVDHKKEVAFTKEMFAAVANSARR